MRSDRFQLSTTSIKQLSLGCQGTLVSANRHQLPLLDYYVDHMNNATSKTRRARPGGQLLARPSGWALTPALRQLFQDLGEPFVDDRV